MTPQPRPERGEKAYSTGELEQTNAKLREEWLRLEVEKYQGQIVALQAELEELQACVRSDNRNRNNLKRLLEAERAAARLRIDAHQTTIDELQAAREREKGLREALEEIAAGDADPTAYIVAREALASPEPPDREIEKYDPRTMRCPHGYSVYCDETKRGAALCWAEPPDREEQKLDPNSTPFSKPGDSHV